MNKNQKQQPIKFHSLCRKIVSQFCLFTLFISTIYGIFCFLLMYSLEDDFIEREVRNEAQYLQQSFDQNNVWPESRVSYMQLYFSK
ncbi:MAG: hypothetical protein ACI971_002278, partial [Colwellia sp.]